MVIDEKIEKLIEGLQKDMERRIAERETKEHSRFIYRKRRILRYCEKPIENLNLTNRAYRVLRGERLYTIGDLICKREDELRNIRKGQFGVKSADLVIRKLRNYKLSLKKY